MNQRTVKLCVVVFIIMFLFNIPNALAISDEEKSFLSLYFKDDELEIISATRSFKSITRVAENVEVITADDIELMNAHTVAEALNNITGVQLQYAGQDTAAMIQSSDFKHVAVFMDGILLNTLGTNAAVISVLPVQNIEKIEIIKGPASSAWGSSLGGVINIITKSAGNEEIPGGTLSASYGEHNSGDFRADTFVRKGRFGYYVYGGRLQTDGLARGFELSDNHFYSKVSFDLSKETGLLFTLFYNTLTKGEGMDSPDTSDPADYDGSQDQLFTSFSVNSEISPHLNFNFQARSAMQIFESYGDLSSGGRLYDEWTKDNVYGAGAKITWNPGSQTVVIGSDYDYNTFRANTITEDKLISRKWAFYANDTIVADRFSFTPGIRYDDLDTSGEFISPSLGITYSVSTNTLLRAYVARGFNSPNLLDSNGNSSAYSYQANPGLRPEKVWSYQVGAETSALKVFWVKVSLFRHDIDKVIESVVVSDPIWTNVNKGRARRQGIEGEFRTKSILNTSLTGGATYTSTKNLDTGYEERDTPLYTYNLGIKYDDGRSFRALLKGNYIWWNSSPYYNAKYNGFIFNLNLIKTLYTDTENRIEAFLTAHNIFNGAQYWYDYYKNPGRWIEGGARIIF